MKFICILLLAYSIQFGFAQQRNADQSFEKDIFTMEIIQRRNVTDSDLALAKASLESTYRATQGNIDFFNALDYWNIAIALYRLKEPQENIIHALQTMVRKKKGCQLLEELKHNTSMYLDLKDEYNQILENCNRNISEKTPFNIDDYISENNLNPALTKLMHDLNKSDQDLRKSKNTDDELLAMGKQNMEVIDSLYLVHGAYIGSSLVGKEYGSTMWLMIQHSDIETMKRYLPVILDAVKNKDLKPIPAKMLIDRIYGAEFGYQIFGSQPGVKMAPEKIREEILIELGIN